MINNDGDWLQVNQSHANKDWSIVSPFDYDRVLLFFCEKEWESIWLSVYVNEREKWEYIEHTTAPLSIVYYIFKRALVG